VRDVYVRAEKETDKGVIVSGAKVVATNFRCGNRPSRARAGGFELLHLSDIETSASPALLERACETVLPNIRFVFVAAKRKRPD
jgi:hypothetical protein